jgi:hypothetical protein
VSVDGAAYRDVMNDLKYLHLIANLHKPGMASSELALSSDVEEATRK